MTLLFSDIDECTAQNINGTTKTVTLAGCEQKCTNVEGSFHCSCRDGYTLINDKKHCKGKNKKMRKMCIQVDFSQVVKMLGISLFSFIRNMTFSESSPIRLAPTCSGYSTSTCELFSYFGSAEINSNAVYTRRYLKSLFHC